MKRKLFIYAILMMAMGLHGCNSADQREQLLSEVNEVHDEAMEKMGTLVKLQKQLTQVADSLRSDSLNDNSARVDQVEVIIAELRAADENMMDWMHHHSETLSTPMSEEEEMTFLQNEKETMQEVKAQMEAAIAKAEQQLEDI
ncbi:hypothetical protein AB9P05_15955 [Roseivirga sp. BDSF3-8]|uniref:hypothetical protein n=1 Tax=Roseivirga sp. BDSF3-8 TaxID=3241598 RepID=UPI003531AC39